MSIVRLAAARAVTEESPAMHAVVRGLLLRFAIIAAAGANIPAEAAAEAVQRPARCAGVRVVNTGNTPARLAAEAAAGTNNFAPLTLLKV